MSRYTLPTIADWNFYQKVTGERIIESSAGVTSRIYGNSELILADSNGEGSFLRLYSGSDNRLFAFNGNILNAGTTNTLISRQSDGSGIVGLDVDTVNTWADPTARIQRWRTGGFEKAYMLASGKLVANGISATQISSTASSPPTVAANAAAGTGATASLSRASDSAMLLTFITGTIVGLALGNQLTITFANAFGDKPIVMMTPANSAAALLTTGQAYPDEASVSASAVSIFASIALAASTTYKWYVTVIGK